MLAFAAAALGNGVWRADVLGEDHHRVVWRSDVAAAPILIAAFIYLQRALVGRARRRLQGRRRAGEAPAWRRAALSRRSLRRLGAWRDDKARQPVAAPIQWAQGGA